MTMSKQRGDGQRGRCIATTALSPTMGDPPSRQEIHIAPDKGRCARLGIWGLICAALLLADAGAALCQQPFAGGSIRITAANAGHAQKTREDRWTPLRISIENSGPETDVIVVASSQMEGGNTPPLLARRPMHLPAQSVRRETFYVNVSRGERIDVEVYEKDRRVARQTALYNSETPRDTLILGISQSETGYGCRIGGSAFSEPAPRLLFSSSLTFMDLPARWAGYAAADVIILGALPPEGLSLPQENAIIEWVRAGGLLVLCPLKAADYSGTLFETASPVQLIGERVVEDVPPFFRLYDPERKAPDKKARIGFTEAVLRDGVVSMETDDGLPLVASRAEGAGTVTYVAFDLTAEPLLLSFGLMEFYRDLIERRGALPKADDTLLAAEAAKNLNNAIGVPVLPRWVLGVCLAANLLCLGAVFYGLRRRRERAFLALVVVAPLLALLINFVGGKATGVTQAMLTSIHVVRSNSGEQTCSGSGYYAVLSPAESVCNVQFPGAPSAFPKALPAWRPPSAMGQSSGSAYPAPRPASAQPTPPPERSATAGMGEMLKVTEGDLVELQELRVRPRAPAMFKADYLAMLSGTLEATATATAGGIEFRVQNNSGPLLSDAWVVCNRNAAPLGDLNPGETATVLLDAGTARGLMAGFAGKTTQAIRSKQEAEREAMIRALYSSRRYMDIFDTGAAVIGWTDQQPVTVQITGLAGAPQASAVTLHVVRANRAVAQGPVLLPKGTLGMQFRDFRHALLQNGRWQPFIGSLTLNAVFTVPPGVRGLKASRIDFFLRLNHPPENVTVRALNSETGKYDEVEGSADSTRFSLPSAEKYLSSDGTVALLVQMDPAAGQGLISAPQTLVIEDFDMEIEGTRE